MRPGQNGCVTRTTRRLWVGLAAVVAVSVVAAGAVAVWWRWDTGRQPRVADVVGDMNRAVVDAVVAAGADAAVAVSPVVRSAECSLGAFRTGGVFTAKADLYTDPGAEDALITGIEQRLPERYATSRGPAVGGVRALRADLGAGATLAVRRLSPGWLSVSARSGCSLGAAAQPGAPAGSGAGVTALTGLLQRLGTGPASVVESRLSCGAGAITTVSMTSRAVDSSDLKRRLVGAVPDTARLFRAGRANRVAYRDGAVSVVVAATDDGTAVSAQHTTGC